MNATIFWRIVWKEYRAQRAFWIAMVAFNPGFATHPGLWSFILSGWILSEPFIPKFGPRFFGVRNINITVPDYRLSHRVLPRGCVQNDRAAITP
jgi:hypothetical protein